MKSITLYANLKTESKKKKNQKQGLKHVCLINTYVHSDLIHKSYNVEASTDG